MVNLRQINWVFYLLVLSAFSLPLSSSLKSIFLSLTMLALLIQPEIRSELAQVLKTQWCKAALLLFGIVLLGCLFSPANWHNKLNFINKYSKLLYLPLLAIAFKHKQTRNAALYAFLLAMFITWSVSILKMFDLLQIKQVGDPGDVFHNHLTTGYFMAFAAFVAALYGLRTQGLTRLLLVILTFLFTFHVLFINPGRTGYLVFGILMLIFVMPFISWRRLPLYLLIILPITALSIYHIPKLHDRTALAFQEIKNFKTGDKNTSIGYRLQFSQYANKLFLTSPVVGLGTASFSYYFANEQPIPSWGKKLLDPHNQYWLMAVEYGVIGLAVFLYFLLSLLLSVHKKQTNYLLSLGLISSFLIANCVDSFFLYSSTGYFFIVFIAIGLGESLASQSYHVEEREVEGLLC